MCHGTYTREQYTRDLALQPGPSSTVTTSQSVNLLMKAEPLPTASQIPIFWALLAWGPKPLTHDPLVEEHFIARL